MPSSHLYLNLIIYRCATLLKPLFVFDGAFNAAKTLVATQFQGYSIRFEVGQNDICMRQRFPTLVVK